MIESWDFDRLFKESDLVVLAEADGTREANDRPTHPRLRELEDRFKGQDTTFTVLRTLQGKADGAKLTVFHFRQKEGTPEEDDKPLLVEFRTGPADVRQGLGTLGKPTYMLFLKRRKDGRYEPVSGEYDPALSVKEMHRPLDHLVEKK